MFCLQFEGVGPIKRIRGLYHFKKWAENTVRVGGGERCFKQKYDCLFFYIFLHMIITLAKNKNSQKETTLDKICLS
jgi:hypothetical protein